MKYVTSAFDFLTFWSSIIVERKKSGEISPDFNFLSRRAAAKVVRVRHAGFGVKILWVLQNRYSFPDLIEFAKWNLTGLNQ